MMFGNRNFFSFVSIIFLWRLCKIKAYVDVCEYTPTNVYCNCEEPSYRDTVKNFKVNCIILQNVTKSDSVWRSLGDAENISYLRLQPRLPYVILEYIPPDLKRMPNLRFLKVQEGTLGTLKSYELSGFASLEALELEGNEIEVLEPHAISNMPKLKKLTLSQNLIDEILADSFSGLLELEIMFLDRNNISRIETCAFCELQNLKELELWSNQLSDLTEYTFRGLRYLRRLDLYKNKIRLLNDKIFHTMERLLELDLRDNEISYISARAFNGLSKLQSLSLGNNRLKALPDDVFTPLLSVRSVDLYTNGFEVLQKEVVDNLKNAKDEYFSLSLRDNPFKCDCTMQWVDVYRNTSKSRRFSQQLETVTCTLGNETMKILEYLKDMDCIAPAIRPRLTPPLINDLITKSTSAPVELNSQKTIEPKIHKGKSKVTTSAVEEETDEAFLRDVVNERTGMRDSSEPGRARVNYESFFVICIALCSVSIFGY